MICEKHGWPKNKGDEMLPCPVPDCAVGSLGGIEHLTVLLEGGRSLLYQYTRTEQIDVVKKRTVYGWHETRVGGARIETEKTGRRCVSGRCTEPAVWCCSKCPWAYCATHEQHAEEHAITHVSGLKDAPEEKK